VPEAETESYIGIKGTAAMRKGLREMALVQGEERETPKCFKTQEHYTIAERFVGLDPLGGKQSKTIPKTGERRKSPIQTHRGSEDQR